MASYLVYICQAVKNRAGLERYWQEAPAVYPENVDVLVGYAPFEVLDADQDERVEGVVIAEFPPFERMVEWFNGDAYIQARKDRTNGNELTARPIKTSPSTANSGRSITDSLLKVSANGEEIHA